MKTQFFWISFNWLNRISTTLYNSGQRLFNCDRFYITGFLESGIRFYINMEYISVWGRYYPFAQVVQWLVQCSGMAVFLYYYDVYSIMQQYYRICLIIFYCSHSPLTPIQHYIENFLKYSQDSELESKPYLSWDTDKLRYWVFLLSLYSFSR